MQLTSEKLVCVLARLLTVMFLYKYDEQVFYFTLSIFIYGDTLFPGKIVQLLDFLLVLKPYGI